MASWGGRRRKSEGQRRRVDPNSILFRSQRAEQGSAVLAPGQVYYAAIDPATWNPLLVLKDKTGNAVLMMVSRFGGKVIEESRCVLEADEGTDSWGGDSDEDAPSDSDAPGDEDEEDDDDGEKGPVSFSNMAVRWQFVLGKKGTARLSKVRREDAVVTL